MGHSNSAAGVFLHVLKAVLLFILQLGGLLLASAMKITGFLLSKGGEALDALLNKSSKH